MNFRGSRGRGSSQHVRGARGRGQRHPTSPSMMPKSEVAQGKKELHPTSPSTTPKSESQWSKPPTSAGSSIHGPISRSFTHVLVPPTLEPGDWSPLDDDAIEVVALPNGSQKAPTRDELHAYILSTVEPTITKKRLPVFKEIYQEEEEQNFLESHDWPLPSPELYLKNSRRGRDPK